MLCVSAIDGSMVWQHRFVCLDIETGHQVWSRDLKTEYELDDLDFAVGSTLWAFTSVLGRGQGLRLGDRLLLAGERGHVATVDVNGDVLGDVQITESRVMSSPLYTTPAVLDDKLFVRDDSSLCCFELSDLKRC